MRFHLDLLFEGNGEYFLRTSTKPPQRHSAAKHHGNYPWAQAKQQKLVLNDVVEVPWQVGSDWALGYILTVHSCQGLTIADPQKVWIIDDYLQWSNLAYLVVSRVEHLNQLERVVSPPEEGSGEARGQPAEISAAQQLRKVIQRKLVAYKRQDAAKGLRFNLKVDLILELSRPNRNTVQRATLSCSGYISQRTSSSSKLTSWTTLGHIRDNIRLTCLECE